MGAPGCWCNSCRSERKRNRIALYVLFAFAMFCVGYAGHAPACDGVAEPEWSWVVVCFWITCVSVLSWGAVLVLNWLARKLGHSL